MKQLVISLSILVVLLSSCGGDKTKIEDYLSVAQRDTLLTNIITYIYSPAPGATQATKFQPSFRGFYVKGLPSFAFQNYYEAKDGWNYFFLIRPVADGAIFKRGVLGRFKFKTAIDDQDDATSLMPQEFEEIVNTPHLKEEEAQERGAFLFRELIKDGNLDKYLSMKHYIEWPDSTLVYDKQHHEWIRPVRVK